MPTTNNPLTAPTRIAIACGAEGYDDALSLSNALQAAGAQTRIVPLGVVGLNFDYVIAEGYETVVIFPMETVFDTDQLSRILNRPESLRIQKIGIVKSEALHLKPDLSEFSKQGVGILSYAGALSHEMLDAFASYCIKMAIGFASNSAGDILEKIPELGSGVHVEIDLNGALTFGQPSNLDEPGNDKKRLASLQPELLDIASTLVDALSSGNQPHHNLLKIVARYRSLIDRELPEVDFARLYALGVRLQNSADAAYKNIESHELPALSADAEEALQSLLQLHGPFVLQSRDGLELLDVEERLKLSPEEVQRLHDAGLDFGELLASRPDLIAPELATTVIETAGDIGQGRNADRGTAVGFSTIRNTAIAVTSTAALASLGLAAAALPGSIAGVTGAMAVLFGSEAIKKSKAFVDLTARITAALDRLSEVEAATLKEKLLGFRNFVNSNAETIEKLSRGGEGLSWIRQVLGKLKNKQD